MSTPVSREQAIEVAMYEPRGLLPDLTREFGGGPILFGPAPRPVAFGRAVTPTAAVAGSAERYRSQHHPGTVLRDPARGIAW